MKRLVAPLLAAAACVHLTPFSPHALAGQSFPLRPGWSMALALDGSVAGRPAVVRLAVEEPLSRVTAGCFASPPEVLGRVRTEALSSPAADGGPAGAGLAHEEVLAPAVQLGKRLLGDVRALRDEGETCVLTLGSEVLVGFVLEVDPAARAVTFHAEMPAAPKFQLEESVVLELTLDPRTDRPSLAVQLSTAGNPLTLPMLLATASDRVQLSASAGRALAGPDMAAGALLALHSLALAPDWVLHHAVASVLPEEVPDGGGAAGASSTEAAPSGILGADAWGHFRTLVDLRGQQLVLYRRPPPVQDGNGPQSWTHLSSESTPDGALLRFHSWQMLDTGGQVPLESAYVALHTCRVGLTLGPEDPGYGLEVAIPWAELERTLPGCARELAKVPAWTGELAVGPSPRPCSGTCIYAQELPSGRAICTCSSVTAPVAQPDVPAAPAVPVPEASEPEDPRAPGQPR